MAYEDGKFRRIINVLLTKREGHTGRISARGLFCTDLAELGPYCQDLGPIFSQYGPRAWLIRYLRNRKHVPCFYRGIETRVKVWENEKCCGNTSRRRVFPQLFRVLSNFHECFYNSIGTRRTCFLFLLENTAAKKKNNNLFTSIIKM